jgi:hypothetical protein
MSREDKKANSAPRTPGGRYIFDTPQPGRAVFHNARCHMVEKRPDRYFEATQAELVGRRACRKCGG